MGLLLSAVSYLWATWPLSLLNRPPPYEYAPLERPRQIRLLDFLPRKGGYLQCRVEVVDLDNAPPFTALSYTHGFPLDADPSDHERYDRIPLVPLLCDGKELLIKPNLAFALNHLDQLSRHGYYWIDQVCINQQDKLEVRTQVAMMGDIYWIADIVIVWLGGDDWDSKVAMVFIEEVLPKLEEFIKREGGESCAFTHSFLHAGIYHRIGIGHIPRDMWVALAGFLIRRWFSRAWTLQEVLLARRIRVLCGAKEISWKRLRDLLRCLQLLRWYELLPEKYEPSPEMVQTVPGSSLVSVMFLRSTIFERKPGYDTLLGNIAGGSENMDLLLGFLDQLISEIRCRSAADPRDKYFALYGIVSRLCDIAEPKLSNPLIHPDYTKSVSEVYIASTKSLLAHSKSLLILSGIEDRSQRMRTDLPSWLPDMTTSEPQTLPTLADGNVFNASKGALPQILPNPNPETLSLIGYWVDTVIETGDDDFSAGRHGGPFEKSASLLLRMPNTSATGQDRVEAFWRTLIANVSADGAYPAPEVLGRGFREHLKTHNATFLCKAQLQGNLEAAKQRMKPLMDLSGSTPEAAALIPSMEETLQRKDSYAYIKEMREKIDASEADSFTNEDDKTQFHELWSAVTREEAHTLPYIKPLSKVMVARRLFRTAEGLLGLGPKSVRPDDHIVVLPGARVPFVLRPVRPPAEECTRACYEMVGEAYLHGIMQGEALDREYAKVMDINLI